MSTSKLFDVIDALVTTLTSALPSVIVIDGPIVTEIETTDSYLTVGWTPDGEAPTSQQTPAGMPPVQRTEDFDIPCYADAYSGDTDTKSRRDAAKALLSAAENALRMDPSLGGAVSGPGYAQITNVALRQEQGESGLEVGITFHVTGFTRI